MDIVLDTNCLLVSISRKGQFFNVWKGMREGKYCLCVSNEILEEYEEMIGKMLNSVIADNVIQTIINSPFVRFVDPHFNFELIKEDPDDNKFVDCAIAANATYIVSQDNHFSILNETPFPHVRLIDLITFSKMLEDKHYLMSDNSTTFGTDKGE